MSEDRWITLYDKDKNPTLKVRLTEEGYKKYKEGEKWDSSWVWLVVGYYPNKTCRFLRS